MYTVSEGGGGAGGGAGIIIASQGVLLYTSKEKHSLTRKLVEYFGTKALHIV